jgi:hypothetical protein
MNKLTIYDETYKNDIKEFRRMTKILKDDIGKELDIIQMRKKGGIDIDPNSTVCRLCYGKRTIEKRKPLTGRVYRVACECTRR